MARMTVNIGSAAASLATVATEQNVPDPYADLNLVLNKNGSLLYTISISGTRSASVVQGDVIEVLANTEFASTGYLPVLYLLVTQTIGGVTTTLYQRNTPAIVGALLSYTFTAVAGAAYEIDISSTAFTYHYIRTQSFQKNDCSGGQVGSTVVYSQEYGSNVSTMDAQTIAMADTNFGIAGQAFANSTGSCMTPLPSTATGILVVDIDNDADLCGYVNSSGTDPYQIPAYTGVNFEPNDGTTADLCYVLASDPITGGPLKRRFEFNIARLINTYPSFLSFVVVIRGRAASSGTLAGSYSLKGADAGNMTMTGVSPNLIPSVSGVHDIGTTPFSGVTIGGSGDGTIGLGIGAIVMTFTYNNDPASGSYQQIVLT